MFVNVDHEIYLEKQGVSKTLLFYFTQHNPHDSFTRVVYFMLPPFLEQAGVTLLFLSYFSF